MMDVFEIFGALAVPWATFTCCKDWIRWQTRKRHPKIELYDVNLLTKRFRRVNFYLLTFINKDTYVLNNWRLTLGSYGNA